MIGAVILMYCMCMDMCLDMDIDMDMDMVSSSKPAKLAW